MTTTEDIANIVSRIDWTKTNCAMCGRLFKSKAEYCPPGTFSDSNPDKTKNEERMQMLEIAWRVNKETGETEYNHAGLCRRCFVNYRNRPKEERLIMGLRAEKRRRRK